MKNTQKQIQNTNKQTKQNTNIKQHINKQKRKNK